MNLQKGGQGDINLHKFKNKWLVQVEPKWCIDKPQANQTHKTHHGLNLQKIIISFPIIYFVTSGKATPK